jgi:hypothetical protein
MAKYDSIPKFLSRKHNAGILLTFGEIERIIGAALPRAAAQPGWWADAGSVQSDAWRSAGYRAELVPDIEAVWVPATRCRGYRGGAAWRGQRRQNVRRRSNWARRAGRADRYPTSR